MLKKLADGWLPICLLVVACAPANKVAEELDEAGTTDTELPSTPLSDPVGDAGAEDDCHAGGGNQPCALVRICESGCRTDTTCLGECRDSLCTAHETVYCDMIDCIGDSCGTSCEDLGAPECVTCVSLYCSVEMSACAAAAVCERGSP